MYPYRTRVVRVVTGWCVERFHCGVWERYPYRFSTRKDARDSQFWWSRY